MYRPKPLDVVKYTTLDHEWFIVLVHKVESNGEEDIKEFYIEDIAVSNSNDFFDQAIWIEDLFNHEWLLDVELLMSNCPDVDTFITAHPEYLL